MSSIGGTPAPGAGGLPDQPNLVLLGAAVRFTGCAEGDMADPTGVDPDVAGRRRAVVDRPWTVLRQVHGAEVIVVDRPGDAVGTSGDALVSRAPGVALAVLTADCAPVVFASPEGVIGVAHAGWRGLVAGVVEATVAAMGKLGATSIQAALGPCIRAECYAFGAADLDRAAGRLGDAVRAVTADGAPALDIAAAVGAALRRAGADLVADAGVCTACSFDYWSWRARADTSRQATVVWQP
ncbi:MAG TPA: polyphenol oxidase family protein [Acidimicrobiales bacterium]|jgi:hypothetical protein|nr:polyphenol oxidase family protein [Acidimicrobiales bacterium]